MMLRRLFKKKKTNDISFDQVGLNLSESEEETIRMFARKTDEERMGDIMILGDNGNPDIFYLIQYAILFDPDLNVRFAALKRVPNFQGSSAFDELIEKLDEPEIGVNLEPYYSMMLFKVGKLSDFELNSRLNGEQNETRKPLQTLQEAIMFVKQNFKNREETLWVSDELNDTLGMNMAIITEGILKAGYMPNGFDQEEGYRVYKYNMEE